MVNKLSNKKSVLIAIILALCLSMSAFVLLSTKAYADETSVDEKPTANVVLDMDGTSSWLEVDGTKVAQLHKDNAIGNGFFPGAKGDSMMMFTEQIANNVLVAVKFAKKYKAENFSAKRVNIYI